jgi:ADP-ribose pyrophosphatase YjhB (NUDIX family)
LTNDLDIRIFFDNRFVELTDNDIKNTAISNDCVYVFEDRKSLSKRLSIFEKSDEKCLCIVHSDKEELFDHVKRCFKYIEAAGGFVMHRDGRILMIKRLGKWDLPKGKAEKNEALQSTALREVMEECGLESTPVITGELAHTYHTYYKDGKHILKHTAWYVMLYEGNETLRPQFDEDITLAVWFPGNLLKVVSNNTYQSILQVLDEWVNNHYD